MALLDLILMPIVQRARVIDSDSDEPMEDQQDTNDAVDEEEDDENTPVVLRKLYLSKLNLLRTIFSRAEAGQNLPGGEGPPGRLRARRPNLRWRICGAGEVRQAGEDHPWRGVGARPHPRPQEVPRGRIGKLYLVPNP